VVNESGDYLVHPDQTGIRFEFGTPYRIQDDSGARAGCRNWGATSRIVDDRNGKRFGVAFTSVRLGNGHASQLSKTIPEAKIGAFVTQAVHNSSLVRRRHRRYFAPS